MKEHRIRRTFFGVIVITILVWIDQYTKTLAISGLSGKSDKILIDGVLQLHYLENTGAAFSMLSGKTEIFLYTTPLIFGIIFAAYLLIPYRLKFKPLSYSLILIMAGAIGNHIDRVQKSYVVDFIYFSLINFPVFNVADIYVTIGVFVAAFLIIFYYKDEDLNLLWGKRKKKNG